MRHRLATVRRRPGFTLAEMLMVIVLFGLVMATFVRVIARQQKFYKGASDIMDMRSQMRQTLGILPFDLRAVASGAGDIVAIADNSITFWAQTGSSIICYRAISDPTHFLIPGTQGLAKRHKLTGWGSTPEDGDRVFLYDDGKFTGLQDDAWDTHTIQAINPENSASANACPSSTGFTTAGDTVTGYRITTAANMDSTILIGAPVRFARKTRYLAYQAADGEWYVGYQDSTAAGGWSTTFPVGGPFRSYVASVATPDTSGIRFAYYDSTGATTSTPALVARVDIALRGQTKGVVDISGWQRQRYTDTLRMSVGLRNRR